MDHNEFKIGAVVRAKDTTFPIMTTGEQTLWFGVPCVECVWFDDFNEMDRRKVHTIAALEMLKP